MNCVLVYQPPGHSGDDQDWKIHRCGLSQRIYFDDYEANYKARWLVKKRDADVAQVIKEGAVLSRWQWNPHCREAVQEFGPEL